MDFYCEGCDEASDDLDEVPDGQALCPACREAWLDAEEYEKQVRADYRASVL